MVAVMPCLVPCPVHWAGERAVITLPGTIDITNSGAVRDQLISLADDRTATLVVVDMAATTFCDSSGVTAIAAAHKKASAHGGEVRVASQSAQVLRIFELTGLDQIVPVYANQDEALA
jgi:anti-anti-sigma factor